MKGDEPIVAAVDYGEYETLWTFTADGRAVVDEDVILLNAPAPKKRIEGWLNIYGEVQRYATILFPTKWAAARGAALNRIACIPVSFEEGEGLDDPVEEEAPCSYCHGTGLDPKTRLRRPAKPCPVCGGAEKGESGDG